MVRFLVRRLILSLITLWLLATIVFVIANVLPNDVGRTILGPFAPQESVDALNERLGTNDPLLVQYARAMRNLVTLDFGKSLQSGQPVMPTLIAAIGRSAILAALALLLTIPISIARGDLRGAARRDRRADRAISSAVRRHLVVHPRIRHRHDPRRHRRCSALGWLPVLVLSTPEGRA